MEVPDTAVAPLTLVRHRAGASLLIRRWLLLLLPSLCTPGAAGARPGAPGTGVRSSGVGSGSSGVNACDGSSGGGGKLGVMAASALQPLALRLTFSPVLPVALDMGSAAQLDLMRRVRVAIASSVLRRPELGGELDLGRVALSVVAPAAAGSSSDAEGSGDQAGAGGSAAAGERRGGPGWGPGGGRGGRTGAPALAVDAVLLLAPATPTVAVELFKAQLAWAPGLLVQDDADLAAALMSADPINGEPGGSSVAGAEEAGATAAAADVTPRGPPRFMWGEGGFRNLSVAAQSLLIAAGGLLGVLMAWRVISRATRALRSWRSVQERRQREAEGIESDGGSRAGAGRSMDGATDAPGGHAEGGGDEGQPAARDRGRLTIWALV